MGFNGVTGGDAGELGHQPGPEQGVGAGGMDVPMAAATDDSGGVDRAAGVAEKCFALEGAEAAVPCFAGGGVVRAGAPGGFEDDSIGEKLEPWRAGWVSGADREHAQRGSGVVAVFAFDEGSQFRFGGGGGQDESGGRAGRGAVGGAGG